MENYLISVIALQKLMQAELSLMIDIIPTKHYHQVFQIIIQESLSNIVHEGEVLICTILSIFFNVSPSESSNQMMDLILSTIINCFIIKLKVHLKNQIEFFLRKLF